MSGIHQKHRATIKRRGIEKPYFFSRAERKEMVQSNARFCEGDDVIKALHSMLAIAAIPRSVKRIRFSHSAAHFFNTDLNGKPIAIDA